MAQVIFSALVSSMTGKMGGSFFRKGSGGTNLVACTTKMTKADSGRANLETSQNNLAEMARSWRGITAPERNAWMLGAQSLTYYNKAGQPYTPSGYTYYCKANLNLLAITEPMITLPSITQITDDVAKWNFTLTVGVPFEIDFATGPTFTDSVQIFCSYPQSSGVTRPMGGYKLITTLVSGTPLPFSLVSLYTLAFGFMPTSGMIFCQVKLCVPTSGVTSQPNFTTVEAQ